MTKIASYILSAYSFIFKSSLEKVLDAGYQSKNGNPLPSFDEQLLIDLCSETQTIFENENNLLELEGDFIIVGDIHGSLHDLLRILHFIQEHNSKVLFLGDYVDRGDFSLECITILFALKVIRPDLFYLIRGNHEFDTISSQYGFKDEILNHHNPKKMKKNVIQDNNNKPESIVKSKEIEKEKNEHNHQYEEYLADHNDLDCYKYSESLYEAFINAFSYLPIGALINGTTFCIHGGLSPNFEHIDSIKKSIKRPIYAFEESQLLSDILWSDPTKNVECLYGDNPRGRGCLFSRTAVTFFLSHNTVQRIIRGHECVKKGSQKLFNEKLITIFSASSYDKSMGNMSAVLQVFRENDEIKVTHFEPIERLQKCDTSYYKVQTFNHEEHQKIPTFFSFHHPSLSSHSGIRMVTNKKLGLCSPQKSHYHGMFLQDSHSKSSFIMRPYVFAKSMQILPQLNCDEQSVDQSLSPS